MTEPNPYKTPAAVIPAAWQAPDDEHRSSWIQKTLMVCGVLFIAQVVIIAVAIATLSWSGRGMDQASKAYTDAAIVAIVSHWDAFELEKRASPEFKAILKPGDLDRLFTLFRKLGDLKNYKGSRGQANMNFDIKKGRIVSATYVAKADFEKGPAEILLVLIMHDGDWEVAGFRVNSPALL
ncbi:MAG TPA: hypothetical protein VH105_15695 [Burkholderiales bacterium]|jgi:hypothetical protein|nr:hypothetical protein [Burkholderiales bacterium]